MKKNCFVLFLFVSILFVSSASALQRPFLYTTTIPESEEREFIVHLDAGWGSGSLGSPEATFIDRRLGLMWRADSRWTVLSNLGFGENSRSETAFSGQAEIFYSLRNPVRGLSVDVGGGMRWEQDDHAVALLHAIGGWRSESWLIENNVLLERASAPERDAIDLIVSIGWLYQISSAMSMGIEAVGQDLEGFWERNEAEGGARILSGPSVHLNFKDWEAGIGGGYVFRPTNSLRTNRADRAFGSDRLAVQFSLSRSF